MYRLTASLILSLLPAVAFTAETAIATFAGGCFWCMEKPFDELDGVVSTTSGYIGGNVKNPSYIAVTTGKTGHTEAVQIVYHPEKIQYQALLEVFWKNIDPTDQTGQFCDKGSQYRSGIFYHDDAQKKAALQSLQQLEKNKPFAEPIVTEVSLASEFYPAESYHQNYYQTNPVRYRFYRYSCGRDARLKALWGDNSE